MTNKELVLLKVYPTPEQAHVDRLCLEQDNIVVFIQNENYMQGDGPAWPTDGVRLSVPADQVAAAEEILGSRSGEGDERGVPGGEGAVKRGHELDHAILPRSD